MSDKSANPERTVTISPSGREFIQSPSVSLLEAGLSAGVALPYRCSNGSCGECRARVLEGRVKKLKFHDFALAEADQLRGECLLCSMTAVEDVVIEVSEATNTEDIPLQNLDAKLCYTEQLHEVTLLRFKFSRGKALRFLPGQYVNVYSTPNAAPSLLPISSCPCESSMVEFHVDGSKFDDSKLRENSTNGKVQRAIHNELSALLSTEIRKRVSIRGPFGGISLVDVPVEPQLFLAQGIEFRVLQGLIEQLFNLDTQCQIGLIWLSDSRDIHYRFNLCRSWADAFDNFSFYPVRSVNELKPLVSKLTCEFNGATVYQESPENKLLKTLKRYGFVAASIINLAELVTQ